MEYLFHIYVGDSPVVSIGNAGCTMKLFHYVKSGNVMAREPSCFLLGETLR